MQLGRMVEKLLALQQPGRQTCQTAPPLQWRSWARPAGWMGPLQPYMLSCCVRYVCELQDHKCPEYKTGGRRGGVTRGPLLVCGCPPHERSGATGGGQVPGERQVVLETLPQAGAQHRGVHLGTTTSAERSQPLVAQEHTLFVLRLHGDNGSLSSHLHNQPVGGEGAQGGSHG